jgi:purine-nucleoside phosphorylase
VSHRADLHTRLSYARAWIRGRTDARPEIGVVLGSGLGSVADRLQRATVIPYQEIPGFPVARVAGHPGRLVVGDLRPRAGGSSRTVTVAMMQGRVHGYEGWSAEDVAFGARVFCLLGVQALVLTNASGGVNPAFEPGDLVRITDHLNLSGHNPLTGPNDERLGPRFPDLSEAYDARLGALLDECAASLGVKLQRGVYACMPGPSYETPAEVRMLRALGADCVGMSTVPEVIAARHMGVPVCAMSLVANRAAGLSERPLTHREVEETAAREIPKLAALLEAYLPLVVRG